ncbi:hemin transport protein [Bordetella pertussis]|uniref:Hemin transport protein n=18 Tax=Bordetella pertussis TaxID=520 RepID=Q7VSQ5_BORPE|nr:hemin-degrading factor [Bordetella pertussis]ETH38297.1 putative hemin transport protein HmuS [Bordetella pertussis H918]ETH44598.1 putative hemin transport protein HmuS [Bordetella pertussis H939]ETH46587.1 putative hemin transport protein HmuS [Bordetella pertussis H921]ETH72903.1 putative hemin transport protein HmuS [Bordetella pertussis STO1-CHLA-0011]ETH81621.1 putative hemin transport protein HmuS [Bordetella pertussis STO1-CHOC-0017]ETH86400.1 putative hemin transport protein HmuS 
MTEPTFATRAAALRQRNDELAASQPGQRARNLAQALGVSEAEWIAAGCNGARVTALRGKPQAIFRDLGELGEVMALTRNDWCVHERHGRYEDIQAEGPVGLVLGPDIDLRVFFNCWASAWAVEQDGHTSLQFFDGAGVAVHKVYRTEATDGAAWEALVARYAGEPEWPEPQPYPPAADAAAVDDPAALRRDWLAMQDTHEFFPLLRRLKVGRLAALKAAGADLAQQVPAETVEHMLTQAAASGLSIMCFVGNRGMIQIHTGPVEKLRRTGPWYNVLDPRFNLHLNTETVDSAWVVSKPTSDGWVTSLELYTAGGELIVQFFGERKPGKPELTAWRQLLSGLCGQPLAE